MKKCNKCGEIKSADQFYKIKRPTGIGLLYKCKSCTKPSVNHAANVVRYVNKKLATDPLFKLKHYLRNRLRCAIKNNQKIGSAIQDLGCSIEELKIKLEAQFQPGMSWDNYGDWHVDHKVPLASFDLTDPIQVKNASHYSNLQPLWAADNVKKGAKCA